jgi:hypothetical protein
MVDTIIGFIGAYIYATPLVLSFAGWLDNVKIMEGDNQLQA